jgi:hypothetical protein
MDARASVLFDDLHGSSTQRDDYARVLVTMHHQRCIGKDNRLPDFHVFVFKLLGTQALGGLRA